MHFSPKQEDEPVQPVGGRIQYPDEDDDVASGRLQSYN